MYNKKCAPKGILHVPQVSIHCLYVQSRDIYDIWSKEELLLKDTVLVIQTH